MIYLETSAILRSIFESGITPEIEDEIKKAKKIFTSRLSIVETSRALFHVKNINRFSEVQILKCERSIEELWKHCCIWEISKDICDLAAIISPKKTLRSLDALHIATFLLAKQNFPQLKMISCDKRILNVIN